MLTGLRILLILLTLAGALTAAWCLRERERIERVRTALAETYQPAEAELPPLLRHPGLMDLITLPTVHSWSYPMGSRGGALIYNAQPFGTTKHLGDDLNGIGGQNSDLGDPVYAAGAGRVIYAGFGGPGWGNIVILLHAVAPQALPGGAEAPLTVPRRFVQTFYAHLEDIHVRDQQMVEPGAVIGSVGTAGGRYLAHLHFEMRTLVTPFIGPGYRESPPANWLAGEDVIRGHLVREETAVLEAELARRARATSGPVQGE